MVQVCHVESLCFLYSPRQGKCEWIVDLLSSPVQSCPCPPPYNLLTEPAYISITATISASFCTKHSNLLWRWTSKLVSVELVQFHGIASGLAHCCFRVSFISTMSQGSQNWLSVPELLTPFQVFQQDSFKSGNSEPRAEDTVTAHGPYPISMLRLILWLVTISSSDVWSNFCAVIPSPDVFCVFFLTHFYLFSFTPLWFILRYSWSWVITIYANI